MFNLEILTGQMKRIPIVQDRQPQGCGCRAYMDAMFLSSWTACLEQWVSFSSVSVIMSSANYFRWLILILAVLVNYGCGFQLRSSLALSEDISPLYIQQNSAFELARELKWLLAKNKIIVANDSTGVNSQLTLLSENKKRRVLSVDGDGRAREYLLTYTVNIMIKIKQSKETRDSVSLSRSLLFDPEAVLAVTNESEMLYRDMQKNAARLILLKLQARSIHQSAADDGSPVDSSATGQKKSPLNSTAKSSGL